MGSGDKGHELALISRALNPGLDVVRNAILLLELRGAARLEAGLKV